MDSSLHSGFNKNLTMPKFDFSKKYILENDFVKLSPLKINHVYQLAKVSNDEFIWKYLFENGKKKKHLTNYIQTAIQNRKLRKEYPFIIFDKTKKLIAGTTRIYNFNPDWKTLKLGHTWYGKEFRGTHLNKHCKYLLFEFVFEKIKMERIGFGVHAENIPSIKALESIGCTQEGALKSFLPKVDGEGRANLLLFSILKDEWLGGIKKELIKKTKNKSI